MNDRPLDVCAGITPNGSCLSEEGPSIKIYLEKHEDDQYRNIAVIVFEDHMSKQFMDECERNINELSFMVDGDRLLRFATTHIENERTTPYPMVTYGKDSNSLRLYEAIEHTEFEKQLLQMGNLVFEWLDDAIRISLELFEHSLEGFSASKVSPGNDFPWPVGTSGGPLKVVNDSCVWVATNNNSYSLHSDSDPEKYCNHNDDFIWSHHLAMKIFTWAFAKANEKDKALEYPIASLVHAKPTESGGATYCKIIGYFCNREEGFVMWNGENKGIPLGTICHTHIQLPGSQGRFQHAVISETKESVQRFVGSLRSLKPQQIDYKMRKERVERNIQTIHTNDEHVQKNISSVLNGSHRFFPPCQDIEDTNIEQHPKKSKICEVKPDLPTGSHRTNDFLELEKAKRKFIVCAHHSFNESIIARSYIAVEQYYKYNTTVIFKQSDGLYALVGPYVYESESSSTGYRLFPVGADITGKLLDLSSGIVSNRNNHHVMNIKRCDMLHLKRITKNSCRLAETLVKIIQEPRTATLTPIDVRGKGGAMTAAGQQQMLLNNKRSTRTAPNYILAANQDPFSDEAAALITCVSHQQCVNVFANQKYCGLYYFKKATLEKCSRNEVKDQQKRINKCLPTLHLNNPKDYPNAVIKGGHENSAIRELWSMSAVSIWSELYPLDPHQCKNGRDDEENHKEWNVIHLDAGDIVIPSTGYMRGKGKDFINLEEDGFVDGFSLLERLVETDPLGFLTKSAQEKILDGCSEEMQRPSSSDISFQVREEGHEKPTVCDVMNLAIHTGGVTNVKAFDEEVISSCKTRMNTPKCFLLKDGSKEFCKEESIAEYDTMLHSSNLKGLNTRSTHPPTLIQDPTVIIAKYSTKSEDPSLQEITPDGKWKYRNGPGYVLGDHAEEAWTIIFQCIVCVFVQPSSLLFIDHHYKQKHDDDTYLMSPNPEQVGSFINIINGLGKCKSRLRNHIMRKIFKDEHQLIRFIETLKKTGKHIIQAAINVNLEVANDHNSFLSRANVAKSLKRSFNKTSDVELNDFHIQVLMRTIECCIHEPFGEVFTVTGGPGSDDGAKALILTHKNDLKAYYRRMKHTNANCIEDLIYLKQDYLAALLPGWLVEQFNARAGKVLGLVIDKDEDSENNVLSDMLDTPTKEQLLRELSVLGLRWHPALKCLVHVNGIGKRFDASDTEHLTCALQHARAMALPSQNQSEDGKTEIDGDKYLPVFHSVGSCLARDLPFMCSLKNSYPKSRDDYRSLLFDKTYAHYRLSDYFRVDHRQCATTST